MIELPAANLGEYPDILLECALGHDPYHGVECLYGHVNKGLTVNILTAAPSAIYAVFAVPKKGRGVDGEFWQFWQGLKRAEADLKQSRLDIIMKAATEPSTRKIIEMTLFKTKNTTERGTCATCQAWQCDDGDNYSKNIGNCRLHSPVIVDGKAGIWPETKAGDWCLEHVSENGK